MAIESTYDQLAGKHVALRATMATWPLRDSRHLAARQELDAIERRMAVLADQEFSIVKKRPVEASAVWYGRFRRLNPFCS